MPSSGRAECALLDISQAMEDATYVQIVAVREEEKDAYLKVALAHHNLDVYVIKKLYLYFYLDDVAKQ